MQSGKGRGTIITGSSAQGDAQLYVIDNGGHDGYQSGIQSSALNDTGQSISPGQIVELEYRDTGIVVTGIAQRAIGKVDENGETMTVTNSNDSGLSGTIAISFEFGENEGWGGATEVYFANVDGSASYLDEV